MYLSNKQNMMHRQGQRVRCRAYYFFHTFWAGCYVNKLLFEVRISHHLCEISNIVKVYKGQGHLINILQTKQLIVNQSNNRQ